MTNVKPTWIGVDVGGSKVLAQAFDATFKMVGETESATDTSHGQSGFLKQLFAAIDAHFQKGVKGIGVAVPGIVDRKGVLVRAPHLPTQKNLKLRELLQKRYGVAIKIENDISAFLAGQMTRPALKKAKNLVAVMIGTGVGGAVLVDGKMVRGHNGFAGEIGHMVITKNGFLRTLEENVSGAYFPEIVKMLGMHRLKFRQPTDLLADPKYRGEVARLQETLTESLGTGLANLNLIFNPEAFVLGGSIYRHFLKGQKTHLKAIIASRALDGKSPALIDEDPRISVARGVLQLPV